MKKQNKKEGKTVCIAFGYGCSRTRADVALLFPYLEQNGWRLTHKIKEADLVLVTGCGYKNEIERRSIILFSHAARHLKKSARLVAIGCLAGINPKRLKLEFNSEVVPGKEIAMLDQIIDAKIPIAEVKDVGYHTPLIKRAWQSFSPLTRLKTVQFWKRVPERSSYWMNFKSWLKSKLSSKREDPIYYLRVAKGCLDECSYCAIRFSSGTLVSKQLDIIIEEFQEGLSKGYKRFKMVAGDIGAYGQDIETNIVELFRRLLKHKGEYRFLMNDFNMHFFVKYREELFEIIGEHSDRFEEIGIPIQSGSDAILNAMKRRYNARDSLEIFQRLKQIMPNVRLATHFLIGFPGETDQDQNNTIDFLKSTHLDDILFYFYDDRPGTEASEMPNKVPLSVKRKRIKQMRKAANYM